MHNIYAANIDSRPCYEKRQESPEYSWPATYLTVRNIVCPTICQIKRTATKCIYVRL